MNWRRYAARAAVVVELATLEVAGQGWVLKWGLCARNGSCAKEKAPPIKDEMVDAGYACRRM